MRETPRVDIADKARLLGISALIGLLFGLPIFFVLGFSNYFLVVQPLILGVCAGLGVMSWRQFFPIRSAQHAAVGAVCGSVFLVLAMLVVVPRLVVVLLPSILVISVGVGVLTWQFRSYFGLEVFFEPRQ